MGTGVSLAPWAPIKGFAPQRFRLAIWEKPFIDVLDRTRLHDLKD